MWAIKGLYQTAVEENEIIEWTVRDNALVLRLLVVSIRYLFFTFGYPSSHTIDWL